MRKELSHLQDTCVAQRITGQATIERKAKLLFHFVFIHYHIAFLAEWIILDTIYFHFHSSSWKTEWYTARETSTNPKSRGACTPFSDIHDIYMELFVLACECQRSPKPGYSVLGISMKIKKELTLTQLHQCTSSRPSTSSSDLHPENYCPSSWKRRQIILQVL